MKADLLLLNGIVRTMAPDAPQVQALAIGNGRIMARGDTTDLRSLAGPHTEVVNLDGRLVLPGFIDSHIHFRAWSLGLARLELAGTRSFNDFTQEVNRAAVARPAGHWILGQGWNESEWPENRQPTRLELDQAAPDHPILLWRCDLHMAVANSAALHLAGIDATAGDPPEGTILRDAQGRPNGLLRESAIDLVSKVLPPVRDRELLDACQQGQRAVHACGITGVCDVPLMHDPAGAAQALRIWQLLAERNEAGLRVWAALSGDSLNEALALGLRSGLGGPRLKLGPLKYFADGGMGARTAWINKPYRDGGYGMSLIDMPALSEEIMRADAGGLAVMVHAIGDRANHEVINILEKALGREHRRGPKLPHRMEHVQMLDPRDAVRLGRLNVVASVQPPNLIIDINMIDTCLGPDGRRTYPFRTLLDAGILTTFSSDAPVCDHNPLTGIHAAVNRTRIDGTPAGGWYPEQCLSVDEAVKAYTVNAAKAWGCSNEIGRLAVGAYADIAVLDQDIYHMPPNDIHQARVDLTIFDGQVVYCREASSVNR